MFYQKDRKTDNHLYDNCILVVDDMAMNRELISSYLKGAGYKNIYTAVDGCDALEKVALHDPQLLILDLVMPNKDGTQVIRELRANPDTKHLPILVQTAVTSPEERNEAWKYGATDVVTKPIHKLELLARVKSQLENAFLIQELENYQKTADAEIVKALQLQLSFLPSSELIGDIEKKYNVDIKSLYLPSRFLSGDMWGMHEISQDKLMVWLCDFSGKGISASLYTFRIHTLISELGKTLTDPQELASTLNSRLNGVLQKGNFCTIVMGTIDFTRNVFEYVAASSTHPIVYHKSKRSYTLGNGSGLPLGIGESPFYEKRSLEFKKGDSLILYSDILWEDEGGIPGISLLPENLSSVFKELEGRSFVDVVTQQIDLCGETSYSDDLTIFEVCF